MNCLVALFVLCCLSAIQPVPIEKRFTQNFYAPVYRQDQAKLILKSNRHEPTKYVHKNGKRGFQQSFNAPIMNQQNVENLQSENFFGPQMNQLNIDNSRVRPDAVRLPVNPLAVRPNFHSRDSHRFYKMELEGQMVKRGFNQQFNGPIGSQQNIENYQQQDYWGPLQNQVNIDNSGQFGGRQDNDHHASPNGRQHRYRRDLESQMVKRGFNQQFNGPIGSQQNIENYHKQDYFGSIQNQFNVDNSFDKRSHSKRSLDKQMLKRDFRQQFHGPIGTQQNIENYNKQDYFGSIQTQLNVDNSKSNQGSHPNAGPNTGPAVRPSTGPAVRPSTGPDVRPNSGPSVRPNAGQKGRPSGGLVVEPNVNDNDRVKIVNVVNNNHVTVKGGKNRGRGKNNGRKENNRGNNGNNNKNRGNANRWRNEQNHSGGNSWRNNNNRKGHSHGRHDRHNHGGNRWNGYRQNRFRY